MEIHRLSPNFSGVIWRDCFEMTCTVLGQTVAERLFHKIDFQISSSQYVCIWVCMLPMLWAFHWWQTDYIANRFYILHKINKKLNSTQKSGLISVHPIVGWRTLWMNYWISPTNIWRSSLLSACLFSYIWEHKRVCIIWTQKYRMGDSHTFENIWYCIPSSSYRAVIL